MAQAGGRARFLQKTLAEIGLAHEVGREEFNGHRALKRLIKPAQDRSHAPFADQGLNVIAAEGLADELFNHLALVKRDV